MQLTPRTPLICPDFQNYVSYPRGVLMADRQFSNRADCGILIAAYHP